MKGLTHFTSGVAVATFFAPAVAAAASTRLGHPDAASSFVLALGGWFGIMPDTFDFKFGRFFNQHDYTLQFDPWDPDPADMARQIGEVIDETYESGRYLQMQFDPMRLASHHWRQYVILFNGEKNEINVVINEIVNTSQLPFEGTAPADEKRYGSYKLKKAKLLETHGKPASIDIMSGPTYGFLNKEVNGEKRVAVEFLPWHRTWSHSLVLGFLLSLIVWVIAWGLALKNWWVYGLVSFLGYSIHILEDLTGHMGGSLIWPFSQKRYDGFCWFKASDPRANFSVDYTCWTIIVYNLDKFSTQVIPLPWYSYFFLFWAIPMAFYFGIYGWFAEKPVKEGVIRAESFVEKVAARRNEEAYFEEDVILG